MRSLHLRFPGGILRGTSRLSEPIGFHSSQGEFPRREIAGPRARQIPAIAARATLLPPSWRRNRASLAAAHESHWAFSFRPCRANSQSFQVLAPEIKQGQKLLRLLRGWPHGRRRIEAAVNRKFLFRLIFMTGSLPGRGKSVMDGGISRRQTHRNAQRRNCV